MAAIKTDTSPAVGRVARWKLAEPVRLYVYALQVAAGVVVLVAAAVNSGPTLMFAVPTVVLFWFSAVMGCEAARASAYSPRTVVQTVLRVRGR